MIAYGEQCQIHDLGSRRFNFGTRHQAWSLKSFCVAEIYESMKRDRESIWHRHQKGNRECPLTCLNRELYTFKIGYYNQSKECLRVVKVLLYPLSDLHFKMTGLELIIERSYQIHSHNIHFKMAGLVRRFLRRNLSSGYIAVI